MIKKFITLVFPSHEPKKIETSDVIECIGKTESWQERENSLRKQGIHKYCSNVKLLANICRDRKIPASEIEQFVEIVEE